MGNYLPWNKVWPSPLHLALIALPAWVWHGVAVLLSVFGPHSISSWVPSMFCSGCLPWVVPCALSGCYRLQGPPGCRTGLWEVAKQCPGYACLNRPCLLEHFLPVHGSLLGLWSFFNCRAGHANRSAHPGSTSLCPGRNQAAIRIKAGGLLPLQGKSLQGSFIGDSSFMWRYIA